MFAVFQVPRLLLQAVLKVGSDRGTRPLPTDPVVVVDAEAKKPVVLEMTEAAEREGVCPGLSVPQALARCEGLVVRYRSEQAERMVEEMVFAMGYSLAPRVEVEEAGVVVVDLRGVNIEEAIGRCGEIVEELCAAGLVVGVGVAESCVVALLGAKECEGKVLVVGKGEKSPAVPRSDSDDKAECPRPTPLRYLSEGRFLRDLPLEKVRMSDGLRDVLAKWGIRTVAAFAKLKRSAVGARLGMEGLVLWDRLTGREDRVVAVAEEPPEFEESWEFEYEVDSMDPLLFLLKRFVDVLCVRMRGFHKVAALMRVELGVAYGDAIALEQKLPEPTSDEEALFRLLAGRLEGVETESPVSRLVLRLEVVEFRQRQLGLFESSLKNPYRFTQTLSRVAGIVGAERVGRPVLEEDGRPDGIRMEGMPSEVSPVEELKLDCEYGMPVRRFRPGLKAAVEFQGRLPIWVQCEKVSGFVKAARGPWLHSGHWWEKEGSWNRVEWDVELNKGGVYRICKDDDGWKVEGRY